MASLSRMRIPQMRRALLPALVSAACGSPSAPVSVVAVPVPAASVAAAAPTSPAPPPKSVVEVPAPSGACLVEADAPHDDGKQLGFHRVYVAGVEVASAGALGAIRSTKLSIADGKPENASLAIDAEIVSLRGTTPIQTPNGDKLHFFPRTSAVRGGWLAYRDVLVASVRGSEIEPVTELPDWVVPTDAFAKTPFFVSCAALTPFGSWESLPNDAVVTGKHVALETESGTKVATLEPPKDGIPVVMGKTVKGRTKISFDAGELAVGEGWIASRNVKKTEWGGLGYGTGHGRLHHPATLTCEADAPLHVRVGETTYAFGTLHAHQTVEGKKADDGSFVVGDLGGASEANVLVPAETVSACRIEAKPAPRR